MIDASSLPFADNIKVTSEVVKYAHDHGVVVEAELGKLAGIEDEVNVSDENACYTDPNQVEEFVNSTGVDSLAIAIGTSHGAYKFKGEAKLRFDILEEVAKRLPEFPIVLHGASSVIPEYVDIINQYGGTMPGAKGVPEDMLRKAATMAVCKINIDSDLRLAFTAAIRKHFVENPSHFDPRQYLAPARALIQECVEHKLVNVLGCNGKRSTKTKPTKKEKLRKFLRGFFLLLSFGGKLLLVRLLFIRQNALFPSIKRFICKYYVTHST